MIVGDFGIENLSYPSLHLWLSHKGWHVQLYKQTEIEHLASKPQLKTVTQVNNISDVTSDIYDKIFNMIFEADDYEAFKEYLYKNEITVDHTDLLKTGII